VWRYGYDSQMTTYVLSLAIGIYLTLLIAAIYFTRATTRRWAGALAGGAAVAVAGIGVEIVAHTRGFWRYPGVETAYGPRLMYPLVVLVFALLALIGWRITRRFGWRGQALFLGAVTIVGTLRDYVVAGHMLKLIVIAPGLPTVLVDAACWAGTSALALAVMRLIAGPASGDRLAPRLRDIRI
jgi:hypothetical protein